ncbi:MAG: CHAD domain-containing protein [Methanimicrococcus sp.]|nr:CHAD domain-containing protein [Methanimicrococcus sp.]
MEIEYKFGITKDGTFEFVSTLTKAGNYLITDKSRPQFTDVFYDTPDFLLYSLGYYLRKRYEDGVTDAEWTLKQADTSMADVHRRKEYKEKLPAESEPTDITDPDILKILMTLAGDTPLVPILTLAQDRFFKTVYKEGLTMENADLSLRENVLADLSVDLVMLKFSEQKHIFTELEVELVNGTESDLDDFVAVLRSLPRLCDALYINRLSKFERGLALFFNRDKIEGTTVHGFEKKIEAVGASKEDDSENETDFTEFDSFDSGFLMPLEKAALIQICEKEYTADPTDYFGNTGFLKQTGVSGIFGPRSSDLFFQKASILLALDSGMSLGFTAMTYNLPKSDVLAIRHAFEFERTDIFPFAFEADENSAYCFQKPIADGKFWTKEELAAYYGINPRLAGLRVQNASLLFEFIGSAYGLSEKDKTALETVAYLKGIGKGISVERKINIAADIILTHPVEGFSLNELKMIALIFVLDEMQTKSSKSSKKIRNITKKIKQTIMNAGFFVPPVFQKKALILSALLEILGPAEETQDTFKEITAADGYEKRVIEITYQANSSNSSNPSNDSRKIEKAELDSINNLINTAFDFSVRFKETAGPDKKADNKSKKELKLNRDTKLNADDRMADASEKIITAQFFEAEKAESGVISAKDIEDVHDMRVALRKIRSSLIIFRNFLDPVWLDKTEEGMKKTLSVLGVLRDLDVIFEKTAAYLKNENMDASVMSVFYETGAKDRQGAHKDAVAYLMSDEYEAFKKELKETFESGVYLGTPRINKKGDVGPVRIRDVLPVILYEKAADVVAYHEWLDGPFIYVDKLHRLRIAAKNFRYTLDFFKDCLGDAAGQLIKEFKELQDILGNFHDAVVAVEVIESYVDRIEEMREEEAGSSGTSKDRLKEIEKTVKALGNYKTFREREQEMLLLAFRNKWEGMDRRFFHERISKIITEAGF